ncbi:MAG: uracil phosphoribosyltransferase [Clostridia bacterium]|nr:uracil phosphoribosyltransferase [Clostridia bacterium]MBP5592667.1 uracil phosphoribosyltransferase [Clostridia bacterium]MBP5648772.1 uracil phosphoribosyltransferase [Clostridia bacterium]
MSVSVLDHHPLIRHKVAILRNKKTSMKEFRELIEEITLVMSYQAFQFLPTKTVIVETPLEKCEQQMIDEKTVAIVPILRAGLGMVNGVHKIFPNARVGHIGMYRDEETAIPHEYYCKLPNGIANMNVILLDPMLATGGSACDAISLLKKRGVTNIKFMAIIGCPEGVKKVTETHPDVDIFVATVDRELNSVNYILPGLGDAGDRLFGTK